MKKQTLFLIPLLALASCGGESGPKPQEYFDAFEKAALKQLEGDNLSFACVSGLVDTHFSFQEDGKEEATQLGLKLSPMNLDLRLGGLHEKDFDAVKLSLQTKSPAGNPSRVYLTGIDITDVIKGSDGSIALAPNVYLDTHRLYLDFQEAAIIPAALKRISEDYKDFPLRGYTDFSAEQLADIQKRMPLDEYFPQAIADMKKELETSYNAAPSDFAFQKNDDKSVITFSTTSWNSLRAIIEAFVKQAEEKESASKESSFNLSSLLDEATEKATLDRFKISLEFEAERLTSFDCDVAFTFVPSNEESSSSFTPTGTWQAKGKMEIGSLAPVTLSSRDQKRYTEIVWPKN